jgi:hypothetical protein
VSSQPSRARALFRVLLVLAAALPACEFSPAGVPYLPADEDAAPEPPTGDAAAPDDAPAPPDAQPGPPDAAAGAPDAGDDPSACDGPEDCMGAHVCCGDGLGLPGGGAPACAPPGQCDAILCHDDDDCREPAPVCCAFPFGQSLCTGFCPPF